MIGKAPEDILGFEHDWLAVDRDGHVALFSTAGGGWAPRAFLADTDVHEAGLDALMARAPTTSARFHPVIAECLGNTWKDAAERGVFAFDSDPNGSPYRLVAAPLHPLVRNELPGPTREAAGRVRLEHLCFARIAQDAVVEADAEAPERPPTSPR